ncbi:MAG: MFS transporter [Thermomicrobiales bacterium]|nr:MFS transporter [Thermomicrobiales bacterium]
MPPSSRLRAMGDAVGRSLSTYRAALSDRNVALLVGAGFISEIGDWFNMVALISLAYRYADTAEGVGGLLAVRMVARLLLQGPAGSFVDRHAGRKLLFGSQIVMALVAASFLLLVRWPSLFLLFPLVIALEAANAVARPAFMVELRAEAPVAERPAATGALFASMTTAQLIGPLLGALALAPLGAGGVFLLNSVTFLGVAVAVTQLRGGLRGAGPGATGPVEAHPTDVAPTGYQWLLRRRDLTGYALVCLLLALLVQATITLFVIQANQLDLGDSGVGVFYAAVAAGSLSGSVAGGARGVAAGALVASAVAMAICAAALALFGASTTIILALAALVIAGFATDYYEVVGLAYFQEAIPGQVYGRFFSLFLLALSAGGMVGALAAPQMEARWGLATTLGLLALPAFGLAALFGAAARRWEQ